jgi:hypothetical protein
VLWKAWPDGDSTGSAGSPWTYDTAGRLLAVPGGIASTAYNAAGQVTSIAYANGVTTTNTYNDARAFLMGIATKDAALATINSVAYTRDAAGRILTSVSAPTAENWTYTGARPGPGRGTKLDRLLTSANTSDAGSSRSFTEACPGRGGRVELRQSLPRT